MEKKLLLLAKLVKKTLSCKFSYIGLDIYNHGSGNMSITYKTYDGVTMKFYDTYEQLVRGLIDMKWINEEDLIPKKRVKKEITNINKGKFL